ncbi:hypothetical protein SHIRM173S_06444 [Streptomyces hirsutus]
MRKYRTSYHWPPAVRAAAHHCDRVKDNHS